MNFYNEIDPVAAAWLRELIKAGHIADGVVDERSIEDITPEELREYTQCHFFAGIGVWSYALRQAGWPDDKPVWTGSCPCQPFSIAGKKGGTSDERHLWPAFFHLIGECKPTTVFGEQVDAAIRQGWLDLVQADLEGIGYTFGAACLPACGFGAPHIRQRLYFVAQSSGKRWKRRQGTTQGRLSNGPDAGRFQGHDGFTGTDQASGSVGYSLKPGLEGHTGNGCDCEGRACPPGPTAAPCDSVGGFWSGAEWLYCRDEKLRPIEPGTFPLAHGAAARVGRLRGYGNAIVAPVAQAFIASAMEALSL